MSCEYDRPRTSPTFFRAQNPTLRSTRAQHPFFVRGAVRPSSLCRTNFCSPLFPKNAIISLFAFHICSPLVFHFLRQAMIDEFDLDQDGEINEQEFFAIMTDDA